MRGVLAEAVLFSAGVDQDCVLALLAADRAAPGELAGATLHHLCPAGPVPRPAAHQLTPVRGQSGGTWGGRNNRISSDFFEGSP